MARKLEFHPSADAELLEAEEWYAARDPALGSRFAATLAKAIDTLLDSPERWPLVRGDVRRYVVRGFPYAVFYTFDEPTVNVVAVAHAKRRPEYWMDRLA